MDILHEEKDYYVVKGATDDIRTYLRQSVPTMYRRFESEPTPRWLVHRNYVIPLIKMAVEYGTNVTYTLLPDLRDLVERERDKWPDYRGKLVGKTKYEPHAVLYLTPDAPMFIVEAVWRALALRYHPDHGGDLEAFQLLKEAYEELKQRNTTPTPNIFDDDVTPTPGLDRPQKHRGK